MRRAGIIVLWALAVGLYALHVAEQRTPENAAPTNLAEALLGAAVGNVRSVEILGEGQPLVLQRTGAGWSVADAAVPSGLIEAFVNALEQAVVLDEIGDEESAAAMGFDRGERLQVVGSTGRTVTVEIGSKTPSGTAVYARLPDGRVRVIGRNLVDYRDLIRDAARPKEREATVPEGPVAWPLTMPRWSV